MAALTLIFGNKNYSSWSLRPWLLMKHHGLEFEEQRLPLFTNSAQQELVKHNSDQKVPLLIDNGLEIWDSLAILEYVSETYLQGKGWPCDASARAIARSISAEMHSSFLHVRNELPMNCRKTFTHIIPSEQANREIERIKHLWRDCRSQYDTGGPFLFGGFSIADAMFAPVVLRFVGYSIPLSGVEQDYVNEMLKHSALKEWLAAAKRETEIIEADEV